MFSIFARLERVRMFRGNDCVSHRGALPEGEIFG
jgi:hypothetical protein